MKNNEGAKEPKRTKDISSGSVENLPVHTPRKEEKLSLSAKADLPRPEKDGLDEKPEILKLYEKWTEIARLRVPERAQLNQDEWHKMFSEIRAWHEGSMIKKDREIEALKLLCEGKDLSKDEKDAKIARLEAENLAMRPAAEIVMKKQICLKCGERMKQKERYIYFCPCSPNVVISIG